MLPQIFHYGWDILSQCIDPNKSFRQIRYLFVKRILAMSIRGFGAMYSAELIKPPHFETVSGSANQNLRASHNHACGHVRATYAEASPNDGPSTVHVLPLLVANCDRACCRHFSSADLCAAIPLWKERTGGGGGVTTLTSQRTIVGQDVQFLFLVVANTIGI